MNVVESVFNALHNAYNLFDYSARDAFRVCSRRLADRFSGALAAPQTPEAIVSLYTQRYLGLSAAETTKMLGDQDKYATLERSILDYHRGHDENGNTAQKRYGSGGMFSSPYTVDLGEVMSEQFDYALFNINARTQRQIYTKLFARLHDQYGIGPRAYDPSNSIGRIVQGAVDNIAGTVMHGDPTYPMGNIRSHINKTVDIAALATAAADEIARELERSGDLKRLQIISRFNLTGLWRDPAFLDDAVRKARAAGIDLLSGDLPYEPAHTEDANWRTVTGARPRKLG